MSSLQSTYIISLRADLKARLAEEANTARQARVRREVESKTFQDRIDKLVRQPNDLACYAVLMAMP
jgi:hypothetical protein